MASRLPSRGVSKVELLIALSLLALGAVAVTVIARPSLAKDADPVQERVAPLLSAATEWRAAKEAGCPTIGILVSEGYLSSDVPREDPWGGVFRIYCQDDQLFVHSDGEDLKPGTTDDVRIEVQ